jgi:hypothetical protein
MVAQTTQTINFEHPVLASGLLQGRLGTQNLISAPSTSLRIMSSWVLDPGGKEGQVQMPMRVRMKRYEERRFVPVPLSPSFPRGVFPLAASVGTASRGDLENEYEMSLCFVTVDDPHRSDPMRAMHL